MATAQTEIESRILELASEALKAFCEDISGTFGVAMECKQQEIAIQTVAQLKKRFKKLVAVNIVDSEGVLDGTFQLIFDQEGLFTLGGVMVMLPEKRILENRKGASADLAESMVDAVEEAGNLLVGSWERIFKEGLAGHGRLVQRLPAFVGKPWDKPQDKIGLAPDEEHIFIPYEMTISPYPAFNGGVIFPKTIFEGKPASYSDDTEPAAEKSEPEESQAADESGPEKTEPEQPAAQETPATETSDDEAAAEAAPADEAPVEEVEAADKGEQAESPEAVEEKADSAESDETQQGDAEKADQEQTEAPAEQTDGAPEASATEEPAEEQPEMTETSEEPAIGPVSGAIKELARSPVSSGESDRIALAEGAAVNGTSELLWVRARDIMQPKVVWAGPDESLQQALIKLQQNDVGYLVVGCEVLEGI
ncbi:MAG: hypothetical protein JSW47_11890, partial [Phycisphaerales bacterium]